MSTTTPIRRGAIVAGTTFLLLSAALPAGAAGPGPNPMPETSNTAASRCSLERIGTQFVACDNLTGNGVRAPSWIPEQAAARTPSTTGCVR